VSGCVGPLCLAVVPSKLLGAMRCLKPESAHCQHDHSEPEFEIAAGGVPCKLLRHRFQRYADWYPRGPLTEARS